jgi:hypothetical protein
MEIDQAILSGCIPGRLELFSSLDVLDWCGETADVIEELAMVFHGEPSRTPEKVERMVVRTITVKVDGAIERRIWRGG